MNEYKMSLTRQILRRVIQISLVILTITLEVFQYRVLSFYFIFLSAIFSSIIFFQECQYIVENFKDHKITNSYRLLSLMGMAWSFYPFGITIQFLFTYGILTIVTQVTRYIMN